MEHFAASNYWNMGYFWELIVLNVYLCVLLWVLGSPKIFLMENKTILVVGEIGAKGYKFV